MQYSDNYIDILDGIKELSYRQMKHELKYVCYSKRSTSSRFKRSKVLMYKIGVVFYLYFFVSKQENTKSTQKH